MNEVLLESPDLDLQDENPVDETKNYLEELVGDDKKFKTPEDLAKGKFTSDNYIKILEGRLDELREDYLKVREENMAGPKLQELIDKLETMQKTPRETTPSVSEVQATAFDPKRVEDLVISTVQKNEQAKKEHDNYQMVMNKLKDRFGNQYQDAIKKRADALDMSTEDVNAMARKNPNLFMKSFDLTGQKQENFETPPRSNERSDNFGPRTPDKRTWSYYQAMRKKDPQSWLDPKIAVQMEKDSQALGKDFYDT